MRNDPRWLAGLPPRNTSSPTPTAAATAARPNWSPLAAWAFVTAWAAALIWASPWIAAAVDRAAGAVMRGLPTGCGF